MPHLKVTSVLCKLAVFFVDAAAAILAQCIKTYDRLSITGILSLEMCVCLEPLSTACKKRFAVNTGSYLIPFSGLCLCGGFRTHHLYQRSREKL